MKSNDKVYRSFLKKYRNETKNNLLSENHNSPTPNNERPLESSELKITELENEFKKNKNETSELFMRTTKQLALNENNKHSRNILPPSHLSASLPNNGRQHLTISASRNNTKRDQYDLCREKNYTVRNDGKSSESLDQRSFGIDEEIYLKSII
jgi:hypothetical protein